MPVSYERRFEVLENPFAYSEISQLPHRHHHMDFAPVGVGRDEEPDRAVPTGKTQALSRHPSDLASVFHLVAV